MHLVDRTARHLKKAFLLLVQARRASTNASCAARGRTMPHIASCHKLGLKTNSSSMDEHNPWDLEKEA